MSREGKKNWRLTVAGSMRPSAGHETGVMFEKEMDIEL
ncbi:hypothetical protein GDO86_011738 [Hymenochirus boettgeri]|uniref:Uncharacterized protein n=1 Tax=Hymenochirus boettgeri TaxID=247094 RepID=A0A8T2JFG1_9PIPI|nr:hypothetical protein GDO86_011738 [Hymenochirus boettgeri]